MVVGIDCLRCHEPFQLVSGSIYLLRFLFIREFSRPKDHSQEIITILDRNSRIIEPLVRVADLNAELVHFLERIRSGLLGFHPLDLLETILQCQAHSLHDRHRPSLASLVEEFRAVQLSKCLAQSALGELHRSFPSCLDLMRALKSLLVEIKVGIHERRGKVGSTRRHGHPTKVGTEGVLVGHRCDFCHPCERLGIPQVDISDFFPEFKCAFVRLSSYIPE